MHKFSEREIRFLELYLGGDMMMDAATKAGYAAASAQSRCNRARKILDKFSHLASKKLFREMGVRGTMIYRQLLALSEDGSSERRQLFALSVVAKCFRETKMLQPPHPIHSIPDKENEPLFQNPCVESEKKQWGKIRGRPFPPGVSGNPGGRPRGARNKITLAVKEGIERAVEVLSRPLILDKTRPYEVHSWAFIQRGIVFHKTTLLEMTPGAPPLAPGSRVDIRKERQAIMWAGRKLLMQEGWPYDPATHVLIDGI